MRWYKLVISDWSCICVICDFSAQGFCKVYCEEHMAKAAFLWYSYCYGKTLPILFPIFTCSVTSLSRMDITCSSSSLSISVRSLNSVPQSTLSNALLISRSSTVILYELDVMAFSARVFTVDMSSVVLCPSLYAAWDMGMLLFSLVYVLLVMHMARMLCNMLSRMVGLRFPGGRFFFYLFLGEE